MCSKRLDIFLYRHKIHIIKQNNLLRKTKTKTCIVPNLIKKGFSKSPSKNKCPRFLIYEPGQDSTETLEQEEAIHWSPLGATRTFKKQWV